MDLLRQFRQHCAANHLVQPGDRLLLAVSGGLDSRVMLDLFCQLSDEWQLQLAAGHVNHQMRGAEADEDEAFVKALAEAAGLPFYSQRVDAPAHARAQKLSLEAAARELRYQALEAFRRSWQARAIVTAHTLDDQAETVLDHILRGCGLNGLAGMSSFRNTILRPLLPFSRSQLEAYARFHELSWREDSTNKDPQFRRNRIRHELLPLLKTRFNPQIAHRLEHLAAIAGSADAYFRAEAEACLGEAASRPGGIIKEKQTNKIILDIDQFWKYFPIIRSYVVRAIIKRLNDDEAEPTYAETIRILDLIQRPDGAKASEGLAAPSGESPMTPGLVKPAFESSAHTWPSKGKRFIWRERIELLVDHDGAVFQKKKENSKKQKSSEFLVSVAIGERCVIPETNMAILVERKDLPADWRQQANPNSQFIDAEKVKGQMQARFPQPGDRFVPLRTDCDSKDMAGSKKLSDFFIDLKVPLHHRRMTPVLTCLPAALAAPAGDDIMWICGYRIDNRFKITPATRTVLHLQLLPEPAS